MKKYLKVLLSVAICTSRSFAASGYKIVNTRSAKANVELNISEKDVKCDDIDSWGQNDLIVRLSSEIKLDNFMPISAFMNPGSNNCTKKDEQRIKNAASRGPVKATLDIKYREVIEWGVLSEGRNGIPYCNRVGKQEVSISDNENIFPSKTNQYGTSYYNTRMEEQLEKLKYEDCVKLED